jgi:hypothetical protein
MQDQRSSLAVPFVTVLLHRGRTVVAALLSSRLCVAPVPKGRSLLTALPGVRDAISYNTVLAAPCAAGRARGPLPHL